MRGVLAECLLSGGQSGQHLLILSLSAFANVRAKARQSSGFDEQIFGAE
jgi:hypothetical protein